jgi:two-component system, cell cycle response regulator
MKIKVLVIEDDEAEYVLVNELLEGQASSFEIQWADSLGKGISFLTENKMDVVLLDLFLPDSQGLETFARLRTRFPEMPIVILSGHDDEGSALEAVRKGAHDFLVKGQVDGKRLSRVLKYALQRQELHKDPAGSPLKDPLTGLNNRQGFLTMAEQHLKMAQRGNRDFFVCLAVLNGLPQIIQTYGEEEGNNAVLTMAEILKESFRPSDVLARLDQDGFAILTSEQGQYNPALISSRISKNPKYYNAQFNRYQLSLSLCASWIDISQSQSVQDIIIRADKILGDYRKSQKAQEPSRAE